MYSIVLVCLAVALPAAQAGIFGSSCVEVPANLCAIVYDESNCGGWKLEIPKAARGKSTRMDWPWYASFWYRNDIESISVRKGCTFTGWDDHGFDGKSISIAAGGRSDKRINTKEDEYDDLHEDIESLECRC